MSTRLNPVINILVSDKQYAYKCKRPIIDILKMVNNQMRNDATKQLILFDSSKALGNIARSTIWEKLYEDGLHRSFMRLVKMGHGCNRLQPKCDGYIGNYEANKRSISRNSTQRNAIYYLRGTNDNAIQQEPTGHDT